MKEFGSQLLDFLDNLWLQTDVCVHNERNWKDHVTCVMNDAPLHYETMLPGVLVGMGAALSW